MIIGNYTISKKHKPFIVAEMSGNHNQSLDRAMKIVEAVSKSGAHMLKLQTYTADTLTINSKNSDFFLTDSKSIVLLFSTFPVENNLLITHILQEI